MKAQLQLCSVWHGQILRRPIHYDGNEHINDLIDRTLRRKQKRYGSGCYTPLGEEMPDILSWIEIRAYDEEEPANHEKKATT